MAERALHEWRHEAHLVGRLEGVRALVSARGASAGESALAHQELVEAAGLEPGTVLGVTDRSGRVLSISDDGGSAATELVSPARMSIEKRHPLVVRTGAEGSDALTLAIAEPVLEESGAAAGTVVLVVDARQALGDLFARANATAHERLFVIVPEAGQILVVAPEWWGEPGASFRLPASDRTTFASAALAGPRGAGEFSDGRGHRVLAATRRIPEIGWAIVVEVDRGEALAELGRRNLWIIGAAASLLAAALGFGFAWSRTARARHYRQIAERDARYRVLLEQTQEAVAVAVDGLVVYANPACVEMFGYKKPLIGVPVTIFFAPGSREQVEEIVHHRIAGRPAPELYEALGLRGDGSTFAIELRVTPVEFEGKTASQAILRDITGRKRMEAEIRESEERYRLLFERNLAGVYRSTPEGRLLECNSAYAKMMGFASPAEAMGQPGAAYHTDHKARELFLERLRREGSLVNDENQVRRKGGLPSFFFSVPPPLPQGGGGRGPARHRLRHDRAPPPRGAAPAVPEDGGGGPAGRRHRARFQQPADRHRPGTASSC